MLCDRGGDLNSPPSDIGGQCRDLAWFRHFIQQKPAVIDQ
jgi:hypothetical protein